MNVIVLKTNIRYKKELKTVAPVLDTVSGITRWNVALDDSDKVLRVESETLAARDIIAQVNALGFRCEELLT